MRLPRFGGCCRLQHVARFRCCSKPAQTLLFLRSTRMEELVTPPLPAKRDQRRSNRFPVIVPVQAKWQDATGRIVVENAQAREVNMQGGLIDMPNFPSVGSQLELTNLISGETYRARLVAIRRKESVVIGVA